MGKKVGLSKNELASISDHILAKFWIGFYKDNSLTYKLRLEERESFQYLLTRGIPLLHSDPHGNNTLHHAIQQEKLPFLTFLLEGTWDSDLLHHCSYCPSPFEVLQRVDTQLLANKL